MVRNVEAKKVSTILDLEGLIPGDVVTVNKGWTTPATVAYRGKTDKQDFEFIWDASTRRREGIVGLKVNSADLSFQEGVITVKNQRIPLTLYLPDDHGYLQREEILEKARLFKNG